MELLKPAQKLMMYRSQDLPQPGRFESPNRSIPWERGQVIYAPTCKAQVGPIPEVKINDNEWRQPNYHHGRRPAHYRYPNNNTYNNNANNNHNNNYIHKNYNYSQNPNFQQHYRGARGRRGRPRPFFNYHQGNGLRSRWHTSLPQGIERFGVQSPDEGFIDDTLEADLSQFSLQQSKDFSDDLFACLAECSLLNQSKDPVPEVDKSSGSDSRAQPPNTLEIPASRSTVHEYSSQEISSVTESERSPQEYLTLVWDCPTE